MSTEITQTTDTGAVAPSVSPSQPTAATQAPPAAALASNTGAAAVPGAVPTWYDGFKSPENKGFVQTKGFDSPEMVIESYKGLEKLMGVPKDRLMTLPEDRSKPEAVKEMEAIFSKLGKPESADKYDFGEMPKDSPTASKEFIDWAKNAFHKANLTSDQAKSVIAEWNQQQTQAFKAQTEAEGKAAETNFNDLKANWGNAYDQKLSIAKSGAKEFGLTPDQIDGIQKNIGYQKTMELFHNIGSKIGEATFQNGQSMGFQAMSPDSARNAIAALKQDSSFMNKYANGDAEAKAKMNRLMADAHPGQMSL